jgi:hypothetical protein
MHEAASVAIQLAFSLSQEMVGWSAGLIALCSAFQASKVRDRPRLRRVTQGLIICFAISLAAGFFSLSLTIGTLEGPGAPQLEQIPSSIRSLAITQFTFFVIAVATYAILALQMTRAD